MEGSSIFDQERTHLFAPFQPIPNSIWAHEFWQVNYETIWFTWLVIGIVISLVLLGRFFLRQERSMARYLLLQCIKFFHDLVTQALGQFHFGHFAFITSLFTFILICNIVSLIPNVEEPTADLMTTFGLGLTGFAYTQIAAMRAHGVLGHFKNYLQPFFFMLPLNIVGNLAAVLSLSFRLFGNIYGGGMISGLWKSAIAGNIWTELIGVFSGLNLLLVAFFVLFEGLIQAFVFATLSLTYLSLETKG